MEVKAPRLLMAQLNVNLQTFHSGQKTTALYTNTHCAAQELLRSSLLKTNIYKNPSVPVCSKPTHYFMCIHCHIECKDSSLYN